MDDIVQLTDLLHIPYPADIEPVFASLPGPAFFPEGAGCCLRNRIDARCREGV